MDNREIGEELSQLARLLFDAAANKWYSSIGIEVFAGLLAAVLAILSIPDDWRFFGAVLGAGLLVMAYSLRLQFDDQYDTAETMRRQALFSEALGWPVSRLQMSEWRQKAGSKLRKELLTTPRPEQYYSTKREIGPQRLAEMTLESAFYTRHLYLSLSSIVWWITGAALVMAFIVISIALTNAIPTSVDLIIAQFIYALIPILLTIDLVGWGLRLRRVRNQIREVEEGLDLSIEQPSVDLTQVLRLVSEYNCQVVGGLPIHRWFYNRWHDEIEELWQLRQS